MSETTELTGGFLDQGALIVLRTSVWTARKKLNMANINVDADKELLRASKFLVDPTALKPIESVRGNARNWLADRSLPFPLDGAVFVPRDLIMHCDEYLRGQQTLFEAATDEFCSRYGTHREAARIRLNGLFNEAEYPRNIRTKFNFEWQFVTLGMPGASVLPAALYEQEKTKLRNMVDEAARSAVSCLYERFHAVVSHMTERLTGQSDGKPKVFKKTLVANMREFLETIDALNITNDESLQNLAEQCRGIMRGVTPDQLRMDQFAREQVAGNMKKVQETLEAGLDNLPSRRMLAPGQEPNGEEAA